MAIAGQLFLFRSERKLVSRHESNYNKLRKGYEVGRQDAENRLGDLLTYLK